MSYDDNDDVKALVVDNGSGVCKGKGFLDFLLEFAVGISHIEKKYVVANSRICW